MINNQKNFLGFNITFNTGENCSLACKYCYETKKTPNTLQLPIAKQFIEYILNTPDPLGVKGTSDEWIINGNIILDFIGGDALQNPELVDKILQYWILRVHQLNHKWKDKWRICISTNGVEFRNLKAKQLVEKYHDVLSLGISIDGCPEIHNFNRTFNDGSGSMNAILENWDWYRNLYPDASTKSTLNKESIPYLFRSLKYMHEILKINYINQNFIFEDMNLEKSDYEELNRQMSQCIEYVLCHKNDLYWGMISPELRDAVSYKENILLNPGQGHCGAGRMPALSTSGKIYPCFRFLPHSQTQKDFSVGNVDKVDTQKYHKITQYTREAVSPQICTECEIESGCPWCLAAGLGVNTPRTTFHCEAQKILYKWTKIYWEKYNDNRI